MNLVLDCGGFDVLVGVGVGVVDCVGVGFGEGGVVVVLGVGVDVGVGVYFVSRMSMGSSMRVGWRCIFGC